MNTEEEILKKCEIAIYALEAIKTRQVRQTKSEPVKVYAMEEGRALVDLRQRVNYWRKTGNLLDGESDAHRYARMLAEMTSLTDWQQAGYSVEEYEQHIARYGQDK